MRFFVVLTLFFSLLLGLSTKAACAESRRTAPLQLQLVSNNQDTATKKDLPSPQQQQNQSKQPQESEPPKPRDLGLNLNTTDLAKQHDLNSLSLQPWTPGRGAVGVKVEVTW